MCYRICLLLLLYHKTTWGFLSSSCWVCKAILIGKDNFLVLFARLQRLFLLRCYSNLTIWGGKRLHEALWLICQAISQIWDNPSSPPSYPIPPRLLSSSLTGGSCGSEPTPSITSSHGVTSAGLSVLPNSFHPLVKPLFSSCGDSSKPKSPAPRPLPLFSADALALTTLRGENSTT